MQLTWSLVKVTSHMLQRLLTAAPRHLQFRREPTSRPEYNNRQEWRRTRELVDQQVVNTGMQSTQNNGAIHWSVTMALRVDYSKSYALSRLTEDPHSASRLTLLKAGSRPISNPQRVHQLLTLTSNASVSLNSLSFRTLLLHHRILNVWSCHRPLRHCERIHFTIP